MITGKMGNKGTSVRFLGYDRSSNGFRIWDGSKAMITRHVIWDESIILGLDGRLGDSDIDPSIFDIFNVNGTALSPILLPAPPSPPTVRPQSSSRLRLREI